MTRDDLVQRLTRASGKVFDDSGSYARCGPEIAVALEDAIAALAAPPDAPPLTQHQREARERLRAVLRDYNLLDPMHGLGRDVDEAVRWALGALADPTPTEPPAPPAAPRDGELASTLDRVGRIVERMEQGTDANKEPARPLAFYYTADRADTTPALVTRLRELERDLADACDYGVLDQTRECRWWREVAAIGDALSVQSAERLAHLTELVREWQEARKPVGLSAPGVGVAETYQAAVKRMVAADEALAACRLDVAAAETPAAGKRVQTPNEAEMLRALSDALTGGALDEQLKAAGAQHWPPQEPPR